MAHKEGTVVPTSVRIPVDLIEAVDDKAKDLGVSRGRYIVDTLRKDLGYEVTKPEENDGDDSVFA